MRFPTPHDRVTLANGRVIEERSAFCVPFLNLLGFTHNSKEVISNQSIATEKGGSNDLPTGRAETLH
jgi:hypothetical protein